LRLLQVSLNDRRQLPAEHRKSFVHASCSGVGFRMSRPNRIDPRRVDGIEMILEERCRSLMRLHDDVDELAIEVRRAPNTLRRATASFRLRASSSRIDR